METRIAIITGTRSSFGKLTAKTLVSKGINVFAGISWYSLVFVGNRNCTNKIQKQQENKMTQTNN